ncbi:MAG: hypothetical protein WC473_05110 [Patescibacteria group bacterium]
MSREHCTEPKQSPDNKVVPTPPELPEHRLMITLDNDAMGLTTYINRNATLSTMIYRAIKLLLHSLISNHKTDLLPTYIEAGLIGNIFTDGSSDEGANPEKVAAEEKRRRQAKERRIKEHEQTKEKFYSDQKRLIQCEELLGFIEAVETELLRARIDGGLKSAGCPLALLDQETERIFTATNGEKSKEKIMDLNYDEILLILKNIMYYLEHRHE